MSRTSAAQRQRASESGTLEVSRVPSVSPGTRVLWLGMVVAIAIGIALLWRYGANVLPLIREAR